MSNTLSSFANACDSLPRWMRGGNGQFGPVEVPVRGPEQLTIYEAMRSGFDVNTSTHRETPLQPAIDSLTWHAQKKRDGRLTARSEKSVLQGGAFSNHADIVMIKSANSQQDAANPMFKFGMDIWNHIEDELHRRRLNAAWLGRKLNASRQVISGWKTRGVPTARYEQIAELFGWSLDRLVTGVDDAPKVAAPPLDTVEALYSPMALDVARMIDKIPSLEQKRRAYALILQVTALDGAPSPIVPDPQPSQPAQSPKSTQTHAK